MLNIGFYKGEPTDYIIKFAAGRAVKEGAGLSFFYLKHSTQIVAVPTISQDAAFVFNEVTRDFQSVTIQGQFTYRATDPRKLAALLNFTVDPLHNKYVSEDPERLRQRITNVIQTEARGEILRRSLEEAIRDAQAIAAVVLKRGHDSGALEALGLEISNIYFLSVRPTPEVAKALEAEYRESLLRKADEAIYSRRAAAVEQERQIKENEQNTAILLEQQREKLIEQQGKNAQQEAELQGVALEHEAEYRARASEREAQAKGKALELELAAYRNLDPRLVAGLALRELGQNAAKVGNLTITSEVLAELLNATTPRRTEK